MEQEQRIWELEERVTELESKMNRPTSRNYLRTLIWIILGVFLLLVGNS
ncbi:hypothetical protein PUR_37990 [Paenibacillus sp. URB8-2]|nr:hypothetical protein PUR_37990 [Paenibacillus sp. URB8-2]